MLKQLTPYLRNFLKGYGTYTVASLGIAYALIGLYMGHLQEPEATPIVIFCLGLMGMRRNMKDKGKAGRPVGS